MKRGYYYFLLITLFVFLTNCSQQDSEQTSLTGNGETKTTAELSSGNDSLSIMKAFQNVEADKEFRAKLALDDDDHASIYKDNMQIIRGDLDGDGRPDALVSFSVEGRGGGNNADFHYAIFLNKEEQWQFSGVADMGGSMNNYYFDLKSVQNGIVIGEATPVGDGGLPLYRTEYKYVNGTLVNTYEELHDDLTGGNFMTVNGFLTGGYKNIPARGTLSELQRLSGNGKVVDKGSAPCGTLFDDGSYRYYENKYFTFEISSEDEVAFKQIDLKGNNIIIYTDKGTLNKDTRLDEVRKCFDDSVIVEHEGKRVLLQVFAGEGIDDLLQLYFGKGGRLESVIYFVQC